MAVRFESKSTGEEIGLYDISPGDYVTITDVTGNMALTSKVTSIYTTEKDWKITLFYPPFLGVGEPLIIKNLPTMSIKIILEDDD